MDHGSVMPPLPEQIREAVQQGYWKDPGSTRLKQILSIDKPPALPKFQPDYLRGVNFFPADWTLSDSYEEHNKTYREIFWKSQ